MMRAVRVFLAPCLVIGIAIAGCATPTASVAEMEEPAHVETIDGEAGLHRITLTARAAERLGIRIVKAEATDGGSVRIPYSSVIYDAAGAAWVYVTDGDPLAFVRAAVEIETVVPGDDGGTAELVRGLSAGRDLVSVGVAELFGTEFEVGH